LRPPPPKAVTQAAALQHRGTPLGLTEHDLAPAVAGAWDRWCMVRGPSAVARVGIGGTATPAPWYVPGARAAGLTMKSRLKPAGNGAVGVPDYFVMSRLWNAAARAAALVWRGVRRAVVGSASALGRGMGGMRTRRRGPCRGWAARGFHRGNPVPGSVMGRFPRRDACPGQMPPGACRAAGSILPRRQSCRTPAGFSRLSLSARGLSPGHRPAARIYVVYQTP